MALWDAMTLHRGRARSPLKHLGHGIREVLNSPDAEALPAEMKELLAKLDDLLADKGSAASGSDLSAEDRTG